MRKLITYLALLLESPLNLLKVLLCATLLCIAIPCIKEVSAQNINMREGINKPINHLIVTSGVTLMCTIVNKPKVIGEGAEAKVIARMFSPYVYKYSYITPEEMDMRNSIPYFAKNKYMGRSKDGLHIYRLAKVFVPKDPRILFVKIIKGLMHKYEFKPFKHDLLHGIALRNEKYVLSDFGDTGSGQIGITWYGSPKIIDMIVETIDEFNNAMEV